MSVHIIPVSSPLEARVISTEDGYNCKCRNDFWRSRPGKDLANGISVKKESVTIDLAPLLKLRPYDLDNPITVFINCGSVPVEERRYWDVTVYNSDRMRKGLQYKSVRIDEAHEDKTHHIHGGVFRILTHPKHDLNVPNNEDETPSGWTQTCSNAKHPYIDTKKLAFRILFHPQLPNLVYTRNVHLWIDNVPLKVKLRGFSIGPSVCLSRNLVNFGGIYVGNKGKRILELHNHSLAAARFQFQVDNIRSTFKICPTTGVIQPYSTAKLEVSFHPFAARSFYKRTYCLIHHQDPLVLDFVGICVPRPRFLPSPITFGVKIDQALAIPFPSDTFEDFISGDQRWGVKFGIERLDFGYRDPEVAHPDHNSGTLVIATSCLPYDTILEWSPDPTKVFTVSPPCSTLPANGSIAFSVNFKPNFPGAFYAATLEFYIYPTAEGYDDAGPPWNYSFPKNEPNANSPGNDKQNKAMTSSPPEVPDTPPKTGHETAVQATPRKSAAITVALPESGTSTAQIAARKSMYKSKRQSVAVHSQSHLSSDAKSKAENLHPEELHSEHGYFMKVSMSRLNEGQEINFMVTPISEKLNIYDLPDTMLVEDFYRHLRHSNVTSTTAEFVRECASHYIRNINKRYTNSEGNSDSSGPPSVAGSEMNNGEHEQPHAHNVSTNIPSIHPSNLILPGNDQANTYVALDGVKKIALPLCLTLRVTGHTFTPQRVPFIPNVKLPLKAVMYASTPNSPTGRTFLIKNLSDLPCFYSLDQVEAFDAFQVRPLVGLIHGNQHEILVARMVPKLKRSEMYKADIGITFNIQDNCLVGLFGYCEIPYLGIRVLYESSARGSEVVCPITIAGCVTYTYVELQNPTGFHYRFWIEPADVEEEDWMIISPKPSTGFIAPNETIPVSWKFAPRVDGMYYLFWRFCFEVDRTCVPTKDGSLGFYEFIVPFTGVAKTSYLKAEPSGIDFDMIQIFDTKSKSVTVTNDGECPVNAHFIVHHEQWLTNFPPELVSVNPSRLSLKPQESATIVITVRPSKTTIQRFYVIYNLEFKEDDEFVEGATMDVFEKHLIDITFMGDHSVYKVTDIIMDSTRCIWDAEQCWSMFSISLLNQLLTPQHFAIPEGTVPQVSSVSFRFPPAPIHTEPCVFKIHLSNVSELKGFWAVFTKPPMGWRRHLQQKICGACGTSEFKDGHFLDSPDLSSQIWAKKFNYNPNPNYGNSNKVPSTCNSIKDLSLFEITPINGSLKSKESQVITIKYSFTTLGVHDVSVLLRVFPAIFIWLDLRGRTLDVNQPFLQLMDKTQMNLHPVSLSDLDPPVQMFWMYNGGNVIASYTVDLEPFEKLKDENFGHAVIECLSPKGDVPPMSWSPIKIRFSPLEYSSYMASLMIYPHYDKNPYQVMLVGNAAMNPSVSLRPLATAETVRKFVLFAHGVPVTISPSHIKIGHLIPTGHSIARIVFLTNLHSRNTMKYHWQNMPIEGGGMISFQPNCGRLAPKEEVSCKIVIQAGDTATVLSSMIVCTIEDETAHVLYEFVLNQWRDYMKNTQLRDSEQSSNEVSHKPEKPETYSRLLAVSFYIGSTFGQFDNVTAKERARMGFIAPVQLDNRNTLSDGSTSLYPFTASGSQLCQSIISDMIWDMIQSPSFAAFSRVATKRKAPLFEEYAEVEEYKNDTHSVFSVSPIEPDEGMLAHQNLSEILQQSIFNLLHEMAERYAHSATKWFDLPPVQPHAFVDIDKHKSLFQ